MSAKHRVYTGQNTKAWQDGNYHCSARPGLAALQDQLHCQALDAPHAKAALTDFSRSTRPSGFARLSPHYTPSGFVKLSLHHKTEPHSRTLTAPHDRAAFPVFDRATRPSGFARLSPRNTAERLCQAFAALQDQRLCQALTTLPSRIARALTVLRWQAP